MIVLITAQAEADLERIGDHIAADSPARALAFVRELRAHAARIGATPEAYPLVPRFAAAGIRRCVHGNYLIFFRVEADAVQIIHILHGAMDYEPLLIP
ncbi:type II toxin-antitoxin system RelE/ParE family toxin [Ancylobacter sp. SL191]|uniref:type II toxin-antitoxin system RelE/ParE family toxin n=1 Tax=Ancylobacter sp. SL191 TaxID=2995166 RepID=UPI00226EF019|nr:type II toxin-antitoxin system RelE/ParE family toxin [Ancylobacter sp. SL191]WAC25812.1 type II toxin-antitoxin system RelE/ParE family toxin [Ancylobacter sp. SL191]